MNAYHSKAYPRDDLNNICTSYETRFQSNDEYQSAKFEIFNITVNDAAMHLYISERASDVAALIVIILRKGGSKAEYQVI